MEENQKKAFDFAADTTKQLITLSTAIITITITFSKDLTSNINEDSLWCIFAAWGLFIISIFFGIFTLMALTGSLQPLPKKEKGKEKQTKNEKEAKDKAQKETFTINGTNVRLPSIFQILTFIVGIIFTVIFGFKSFSANELQPNKQMNSEEITIIKKTEYKVKPTTKIDTLQIK